MTGTRIGTSVRSVVVAVSLTLVVGTFSAHAQNDIDPLEAAFTRAGVSPESIGYSPRSHWLRYPDPNEIRFQNRLFNDLFMDPSAIYPTISIMARAGEGFLEPSYSDSQAVALFKLAYFTGWDPYIAGFRAYNAGMTRKPDESDPLVNAIVELWNDSGRTLDPVTFETPPSWPSQRDVITAKVASLDPELRRILAQAVLDLHESRQWHRKAFRNVDMRDVLELWNVRDWGDTQSGGAEYFHQVEDIDDSLDRAALVTSSRKAVFAANRLAIDLQRWSERGRSSSRFAGPRLVPNSSVTPAEEGTLSAAETRLYTEKRGTRSHALVEQSLDLWTPAGRIVVGSASDDVHEEREILLLVDLGGNDTYRESIGATSSPTLPVSIAVDLSGNDRYEVPDEMTLSQGAGVFGTGVLIDVVGTDEYEAGRCAQGYGFFGTGLLADMDGDDHYVLGTAGQGCGFFGVGLLFDRGGSDHYFMDGLAQGYGGIGGVGTLVDYTGDDVYSAETDSRKVPRPDYSHSAEYVNGTSGQGAGMGRRGDITDGHSWGGGLGTLIDLGGNDDYLSGNWTQGSGYWYGMGFLYDKSGNDRYCATTFSIASGAHFCIGGLFDEAGDDEYIGLADARTGMGFGHDFTVAILFDREGDDVYRFGWQGIGAAINTSQAFFVDGAGDDSYVLHANRQGFGSTDFSAGKLSPGIEANYQARATQIGMFLDLGGDDRYLELDSDQQENLSATYGNNRWIQRPEDPAEGLDLHFGIFYDTTADIEDASWFQDRLRRIGMDD